MDKLLKKQIPPEPPPKPLAVYMKEDRGPLTRKEERLLNARSKNYVWKNWLWPQRPAMLESDCVIEDYNPFKKNTQQYNQFVRWNWLFLLKAWLRGWLK